MKELPTSYSPQLVEDKWTYFWERKGFLHADALSEKKPFCLLLPPPNVTGALHMGHALVDTLQDVMVRWKRMSGFETLWVPGVDHAGIATQAVVEKELLAKLGKSRREFSREEFITHIWEWKERKEKEILEQLKKLGCSCDWLRHRFTMDKDANLAVKTTFKRMYEEGLIYQGNYLVNWDPITQTALSDDEVEQEEREGKLYYIRYPLEEEEGYLTVATTRPETMLGDVAVAVSPKDKRYLSYVGKRVLLPIMNRSMPILADPFVDPAFGTGVVKITPAHDFNDYEMGLRHRLPMINIMAPDGTVNENGFEYEGLLMQEAHYEIIKKLTEMKLIEKVEAHTHRVGISYRSKAAIEPYLSKQWFIKMAPFKQKLIDAVKKKKVKLIPEGWDKTYFHWIENLRDWCISRQLWWGHQIPIWYHKEDPEQIICFAGEGKPPEVISSPEEWVQDNDVLDTWFSSGLWPFSALGYPHSTNELKKFYPTSVLITGHDILFFWVARMIMMGEYVMGRVPFQEVGLTGLIYGKSYFTQNKEGGISYVPLEEKKEYDLGKPLPKGTFSRWEKMSKTKRNVIDPLEMIQTYGADATRLALCSSATQSREIDLDVRRFEEFKNFANKIWNGTRFVLINLTGEVPLTPQALSKGLKRSLLALEDFWILSRLNQVIQETEKNLNSHLFEKAAMGSYTFFWDQFCAYYLEIAKPILFGKRGSQKIRENKQKILFIVLLATVRLLHPITPFITEEIFHFLKELFPHPVAAKGADLYTKEALKALTAPSCIVAPYPKVIQKKDISKKKEKEFEIMQEIIRSARNIRAEMSIPPQIKIDLIIEGTKGSLYYQIAKDNEDILHALIPLNSLKFSTTKKNRRTLYSHALLEKIKLIIPLPIELKEMEKIRLLKEGEKIASQINQMEEKLKNKQFVERAPKELVAQTKKQLRTLTTKLLEINQKIESLY